MKKTIIVLLSALYINNMFAQTREGGISPQMLQQIQRSQQTSPADKAIRNAIAANNIDVLAKNHDNAKALDTYFSHETKKQSITDQKSSGRCWMFSGMNVLRANFAQRNDSMTVKFSQDYLFFWDQLEKTYRRPARAVLLPSSAGRRRNLLRCGRPRREIRTGAHRGDARDLLEQ